MVWILLGGQESQNWVDLICAVLQDVSLDGEGRKSVKLAIVEIEVVISNSPLLHDVVMI
jgi:hypothetical protein